MSDKLSVLTIPDSAAFGETNFEPDVIKVIIGINNTVIWMNQDSIPSSVVADYDDDPGFANVTQDASLANRSERADVQ